MGKYIVTGCDDGQIIVFDFILGDVSHKFNAHNGTPAIRRFHQRLS